MRTGQGFPLTPPFRQEIESPAVSAHPTAAAETASFYEVNAEDYSRDTRAIDMRPEIKRFLSGLAPGAKLLDLGCGGGRDLAVFGAAGYEAIGLDSSPSLARLAEDYSGCRVTVADLREPPFPKKSFDGIWASASLLHLKRDEFVPTLGRLARLLRPAGHLFVSMKTGTGEERASDGRWFTYVEPDEWRALLASSGFTEIMVEPDVERTASSPRGRPAAAWIQSFAVARR